MERFCPSQERWTGVFMLPWRCVFGAQAAHSHYLYVCGGCEGVYSLALATRFNQSTEEWERMPPMRTARSGAAAAATAVGDIFVCGGFDHSQHEDCDSSMSTGVQLSSVECFRQCSGAWEQLESMATHHSFSGSAVVGDHLYVLGGKGEHGVIDHAERFDLRRESWERLPPMPEPLIGGAYTVVHPRE
eukprot:UN2854